MTRFRGWDQEYELLESRIPPKNSRVKVHREEGIQLLGVKAKKAKLPPVPWITIWDEEQNDFIDFFTNQRTWNPVTIADIYKERWQIESFFRALKQNLKVKTFVGTSENAIGTQIGTALIAMLILKSMCFRSQIGLSPSNLVAIFRIHLFTFRDLQKWLDHPIAIPGKREEPPPHCGQDSFSFTR